jgi:hypothetical protein
MKHEKDTQTFWILECVDHLDNERMVGLGKDGLFSHNVLSLLLFDDELLVTNFD